MVHPHRAGHLPALHQVGPRRALPCGRCDSTNHLVWGPPRLTDAAKSSDPPVSASPAPRLVFYAHAVDLNSCPDTCTIEPSALALVHPCVVHVSAEMAIQPLECLSLSPMSAGMAGVTRLGREFCFLFRRIHLKGWQDDSISRGACCQALTTWSSIPTTTCGLVGWREPMPSRCPRVSLAHAQ